MHITVRAQADPGKRVEKVIMAVNNLDEKRLTRRTQAWLTQDARLCEVILRDADRAKQPSDDVSRFLVGRIGAEWNLTLHIGENEWRYALRTIRKVVSEALASSASIRVNITELVRLTGITSVPTQEVAHLWRITEHFDVSRHSVGICMLAWVQSSEFLRDFIDGDGDIFPFHVAKNTRAYWKEMIQGLINALLLSHVHIADKDLKRFLVNFAKVLRRLVGANDCHGGNQERVERLSNWWSWTKLFERTDFVPGVANLLKDREFLLDIVLFWPKAAYFLGRLGVVLTQGQMDRFQEAWGPVSTELDPFIAWGNGRLDALMERFRSEGITANEFHELTPPEKWAVLEVLRATGPTVPLCKGDDFGPQASPFEATLGLEKPIQRPKYLELKKWVEAKTSPT